MSEGQAAFAGVGGAFIPAGHEPAAAEGDAATNLKPESTKPASGDRRKDLGTRDQRAPHADDDPR